MTKTGRNGLKPEFLSGSKLTARIKKLLLENNVDCAVAFWGRGCDEWFNAPAGRIVCNLKAGGTNPYALIKLKRAAVTIRQDDILHAKVYIGKHETIVSSANVSANGLGFEGEEQNGWHEAGVVLPTSDVIREWFALVWENSAEILSEDWADAKKKWKARQGNKPTAISFDRFDLEASGYPLLNWIDGEYTVNDEDAIRRVMNTFNPTIEQQQDDGIEPEGPNDFKIVAGKWILNWYPKRDGLPREGSKLWFVKMTDIVIPKSWSYEKEKKKRDSILAEAKGRQPPWPFDCNEKRFRIAFRETLRKYPEFHERAYKGSWFESRKDVKQFWKDVKRAYSKMSGV